jgi:hypothetical protein
MTTSKPYAVDTTTGDTTWMPATALLAGMAEQRFLLPGHYYQCTPTAALTTSNSPANGDLRLTPFYVPSALTLSRLGMEVTTVGDTGSTLRLGIYADNGTGYPGGLVLDAGTILGDSATVQELTISQALAAGLYWVGAVVQGVTTTKPTLRTLSSHIRSDVSMGTATPIAGQVPNCCWVQGGVTGALPSTFSTAKSPSATAPRMFVKVA